MKILIIGLGSIGRKHVEAIRNLEATSGQSHSIYALRSHAGASDMPGVTNIYSYQEAEALSPDFIIVSNPTSMHLSTIDELLSMKRPLMIEKPAFHEPQSTDIIERISKSGCLTYVACNLRFLGAIDYISQRLKNEKPRINEVNVYCGSSLPSWRPGTDYRKSYSANASMGGGAHIDLIHEIDYVCALFGFPQYSRGICRSRSSIDIDAIDYAHYTLVYPDFCTDVTLNYYRPVYKRTLEIVMDSDIWTVDLAQNTVTDAHGHELYHSDKKIIDTYTDQMAYFMDLVNNGAKDSINNITFANETLKIATTYEGSEK